MIAGPDEGLVDGQTLGSHAQAVRLAFGSKRIQ